MGERLLVKGTVSCASNVALERMEASAEPSDDVAESPHATELR